MDKNTAIKLSREKKITYGEIKEILRKARRGVKDWRQRSNGNPSFTKGATFNIFARGIKKHADNEEPKLSVFTRNILWEFGEYSQYADYETERKKPYTGKSHHQEPVELDF